MAQGFGSRAFLFKAGAKVHVGFEIFRVERKRFARPGRCFRCQAQSEQRCRQVAQNGDAARCKLIGCAEAAFGAAEITGGEEIQTLFEQGLCAFDIAHWGRLGWVIALPVCPWFERLPRRSVPIPGKRFHRNRS